MLKAQDNSDNLIAIYVFPNQQFLSSSVQELVIFFLSCSNKIRIIMTVIAATMFKIYAVIINISHYVFVMLSWNGEQLNANSDFQNV